MMRTNRFGMTRIEWLVDISIIAIVLALLLPPAVDESRHGRFMVHCMLGETRPADPALRLILGNSSDLNGSLEETWYTKWHVVEDESQVIGLEGTFRKEKTWIVVTTLRHEIALHDVVIAEYSLPDESKRYRVVPFQRTKSQKVVEVTIPRDPPSDAEAWKPKAAEGQTYAAPQ